MLPLFKLFERYLTLLGALEFLEFVLEARVEMSW